MANSREKKTGKGVKSMLVAKEKRIRPPQKAFRFSSLRVSLKDSPYRILEATATPLHAKSMVFSSYQISQISELDLSPKKLIE
jgi:hypothetical protein